MPLEPLLPSEQIELAIYRFVSMIVPEWTTGLPALVARVKEFAPKATEQSIIERLEDLNTTNNLALGKWSLHQDWVPREEYESHDFFQINDFRIQITPQGQKYFESLESREKQSLQTVGTETERPLVFISCGQATEEERGLGRAMSEAVEELTECQGYFAENQTSLQGLSQHILGALNRCTAFVAVLHHRGQVKTRHGEHIRASVWIEQEIAIVASRVQATGREIPVLIYIQKGVRREGLRDLLILNPVAFETEDEVIQDFRNALSSGQLKPLPDSVKDGDAYEQARRKQFEEAVSQLDQQTKKVLRRVVAHDSINELNLIQEFGQNVRSDHLSKIENLGIIESFNKEGQPRLHWRIKEHMRHAATVYFSKLPS